jgi:hypothetical protein
MKKHRLDQMRLGAVGVQSALHKKPTSPSRFKCIQALHHSPIRNNLGPLNSKYFWLFPLPKTLVTIGYEKYQIDRDLVPSSQSRRDFKCKGPRPNPLKYTPA